MNTHARTRTHKYDTVMSGTIRCDVFYIINVFILPVCIVFLHTAVSLHVDVVFPSFSLPTWRINVLSLLALKCTLGLLIICFSCLVYKIFLFELTCVQPVLHDAALSQVIGDIQFPGQRW